MATRLLEQSLDSNLSTVNDFLIKKYGSKENLAKANRNGDWTALMYMSYCLQGGIFGFKKNLYKARKFLQKFVDSGHGFPCDYLNLGVLYEAIPGNPEPHDVLKAFNLYKHGAEMGDPIAQYNTAECYHCGIPGKLDINLAEAEKWYMLSAGESESDQTSSSNMLVTLQRQVYAHISNKSTVNAPLQSRFSLWEMFSTTENQFGKPQPVDAIKHLQIAAEEGYTAAEREYGKLFLHGGFGMNTNPGIAKVWLLKAAEKGDEEAIQLLKSISLKEQHVQRASTKISDSNPNKEKQHGKEVQLAKHSVSKLKSSEKVIDPEFDPLSELLQEKTFSNPFEPGSTMHIKFEQIRKAFSLEGRLGTEVLNNKRPMFFHEDMFLQYPHSPTAKRYVKALKYFNDGLELLLDDDISEKVDGIHLLVQGYVTADHVCQSPILAFKIREFRDIAADGVRKNNKDYSCRYFLVRSLRLTGDATDRQEILDRELLITEIEESNENSVLSLQILYELYYTLGSLYTVTTQNDRAMYCFQKAYDMEDVIDKDNDALRGIAYNKRELGDVESAIDLYKKYLETTPRCERRYPSAHFHLAGIYISLKSQQLVFYHYEQGLKAEANRLPIHEPEDIPVKEWIAPIYDMLSANVCNNPDCQTPDDKNLKQCPCKLVYYCSTSCEKAHRPVHKKICTVKK